MKSSNKIKRFYQQVQVSTNQEMNESVFQRLQSEYIQASKTKLLQFKLQSRCPLFRISLTRVAMVAVFLFLMAIALVVSHFFGESSVVWADVQASFSQQPCLHFKTGEYPNESEFWVRLNPPQIFMKGQRRTIWELGGGQEDRCYVLDFSMKQKWTYNSLRKTIVASSLTAKEQEDEPTDFINYAQNMAALLGQGELYGYDVITENESSGQETSFQLIQSGVKLASIYIDDSNNLPTHIRVYQDQKDAKIASDTYQDLYFDYPPISPTSIRDLGVPEDIAVIQINPPEPDLLTLAKTHDSARRLSMNYQGMSFFTTSQTKSERFDVGVFQLLGEQGKARDFSMGYMTRFKSRTAEEKADSILGFAPGSEKTTKDLDRRARSLLGKWDDKDILSQCVFPDIHIPLKPRFQNMIENSGDGQWQIVHPDDPALSSAIGLQFINRAIGKSLQTWWLDPEHDYWVCGYDINNVETPKYRASNFIPKMTYRVPSFAKTSEGKWYPSGIQCNYVTVGGEETEDTWSIYLEALSQSDTTLTRDFLIRAFGHLID